MSRKNNCLILLIVTWQNLLNVENHGGGEEGGQGSDRRTGRSHNLRGAGNTFFVQGFSKVLRYSKSLLPPSSCVSPVLRRGTSTAR
jgi:hypothetical protein